MKTLMFDLEHGSQTLGSKEYIHKNFGFPVLQPGSWDQFQATIGKLYKQETLTEVIKACGESIDVLNIPSTQEAFIEAQKSSAPRKEYNWTTPIIYWAAREVGWDIINSSNNPNTFKLFSKVYARLANKMN